MVHFFAPLSIFAYNSTWDYCKISLRQKLKANQPRLTFRHILASSSKTSKVLKTLFADFKIFRKRQNRQHLDSYFLRFLRQIWFWTCVLFECKTKCNTLLSFWNTRYDVIRWKLKGKSPNRKQIHNSSNEYWWPSYLVNSKVKTEKSQIVDKDEVFQCRYIAFLITL
jgi:hypothetical protein